MKKIVTSVLLASLLVSANATTNTAVLADTESPVNTYFEDDFSRYETGNYIEENQLFMQYWSNDKIENTLGYMQDDGTEYAPDAECTESAKVITDPSDSTNKVLHIKNDDPISSFFYIAPIGKEGGRQYLEGSAENEFGKGNRFCDDEIGLKLENYEFWMDVYALTAKEAPWIALSAKKANNVRFNGTNNELLSIKYAQDTNNGYENSAYLPLRGYGGAGNPSDQASLLDTVKDVYGGLNSYGEVNKDLAQNKISNMVDGVVDTSKNVINQWITYRFIVEKDQELPGCNYSLYAYYPDDTEVYMGTMYYSSSSVNGAGYMSINACIMNAYVDNVKVTALTGYENKVFDIGDPSDALTEVTANTVEDKQVEVNTELSIPLSELFTITGDTTSVSYEASAGSIDYITSTFKYTPTATPPREITITAKYNQDDETVVKFKVSGKKADTESSETTQTKPSGGCGGSLGGSALLFVLMALIVAKSSYKKIKE